MEPELWQLILRRAQKALHNKAAPSDVDAMVAEDSAGQFPTLAALTEGLRQATAKAAVQPGPVEGVARSLTKGMTFGFNDEIAGGVDKLLGGDYRTTRNAERGADAAFNESDSKKAFVAELVGGVLPFLGSSAVTAPVTAAQLARTGAAVGGAAGALSGAGNADELSDVPIQTAIGGAVGAPLGAALGAASKPITDAAVGIGRGARRVFAPGADTRAAVPGILARFLPEDAASRMAVPEAVRPGQAMLGDLNPDALDVASSMVPGAKQDVAAELLTRNAGAPASQIDDLTAAAVGPSMGASRAVDAKAAEAAAREVGRWKGPMSKALYEPLEQQYPVVTMNDQSSRMFEALTDPKIEAIYRKIAPAEGQSTSFKTMQSVLRQAKDDASALMVGGRVNEGGALKEAASALEAGMEQAMPGFKAANRGWAQTQKTIEAFDLGRGALRKDARDIASDLAQLGPDAQSAYRMAALDDLTSRLGNLSEEGNAFRESMRKGNKSTEAQLKALFGDTAEMSKFLDGAEVDQMFRATYAAMQGSKTQPRQEVAKAMFGHGDNMPSSVLTFFKNLGTEGRDERIARAVLPAFRTRSGSPEMQRVLTTIEEFRRNLLQADATRVQGAQVLGGAVGEAPSRLQRRTPRP